MESSASNKMPEPLSVEEGEEIDMSYEEYLIYSARIGEFDDVKEMLDEKTDVNTKDKNTGNTALHMACANGHYDIVKLLLKHNADTNILNNPKNTPLRNQKILIYYSV